MVLFSNNIIPYAFCYVNIFKKKISTNSCIVCHYNIYGIYAGIEEQLKLCIKRTAESNLNGCSRRCILYMLHNAVSHILMTSGYLSFNLFNLSFKPIESRIVITVTADIIATVPCNRFPGSDATGTTKLE